VKLVGRVPVEPLDDERWTNIERRIVAGAADAAGTHHRESRFSFARLVAATAVVAIGAGLVGWKLHAPGAPAHVAEAPLRVQTDAVASTIDIGDAKITSDPSTRFEVTRPDGGVLVSMTRGKVDLQVGKRGDRPPLVVHAGDTDVVVVGTQFSVDFGDGSGHVDVRVTEGVVKVVRQQREDRVAAGEAWLTEKGKLTIAEVAKLDQLAAVDRKDTEIRIPTDGPDIGLHDRVAKVPDARIPTTTVHPDDHDSPRPTVRPDHIRRPTIDPPTDPRVDLKTDIRRQGVLPAMQLGTLDATHAVAKLREIASFKRGPEASLALYSIAVLQHLKLGRDSDALATLDMYRRRFSPKDDASKKEYNAALWLRVRISCLRQIDDQCRQAAFTYAHEEPGTPAGRVAERLSITSD